mmetsp:Transcript_69402/g.224423  ORF Transcript_69402/g.224423 Transcript_69402/m.224423 type:complete len:236 (+) Transcript_69402:1264-1971(+)
MDRHERRGGRQLRVRRDGLPPAARGQRAPQEGAGGAPAEARARGDGHAPGHPRGAQPRPRGRAAAGRGGRRARDGAGPREPAAAAEQPGHHHLLQDDLGLRLRSLLHAARARLDAAARRGARAEPHHGLPQQGRVARALPALREAPGGRAEQRRAAVGQGARRPELQGGRARRHADLPRPPGPRGRAAAGAPGARGRGPGRLPHEPGLEAGAGLGGRGARGGLQGLPERAVCLID